MKVNLYIIKKDNQENYYLFQNEKKLIKHFNKKKINTQKIPTQEEINLLHGFYQKGEYDKVENIAKILTKKHPNHSFGWIALGIALQKLGRIEESKIPNQRAVELLPNNPLVYSNLGNTLKDLNKLEEAEICYKKAISLKSDLTEAYFNLGLIKQRIGKLDDAEIYYKKAIELNSNFTEAYINLGITLNHLQKIEPAINCFNKVILLKPDSALAYLNLGNILKELGRLEEAENNYKKAISFKTDFAEAYINLGITLKERGKFENALESVIKSLTINPSIEAKKLFTEIVQKININSWNQTIAQLVIKALLEPWGRPSDLMAFACQLIKKNEEFINLLNNINKQDEIRNLGENILSKLLNKDFSAFSLLCAMLSSSPISDDDLEEFLIYLRKILLNEALSELRNINSKKNLVPLYCFLAQQCYINEYVYIQTPEEINYSYKLRVRLEKEIQNNDNISELLLIALASYLPLNLVENSEKLLSQKWSKDVEKVLKQQIQDPLEESSLRATIPRLTIIDEQISLNVQRQYEENPYPRWVHIQNSTSKKFLNSYIQSKFPISSFRRLIDDKNPEILIAGCGTGQHSIERSQLINSSKILAVDLSIASLAYAKRKSIELGIDSISYAQADLLKLTSLGKTFDLIESVGVLHHLENPLKGWKILLSLLRPDGLMMLGFYSQLARRDIFKVRKLIEEEGIGTSSQEIRDFRRYLTKLKDSEDYGFAVKSSDFYSISACRDLLFHVKEHQMTIPTLENFLNENNLNFLGFELDALVKHSYKSYFPDDLSLTNLKNWNIYETKFPDTFNGMYQFWIQIN